MRTTALVPLTLDRASSARVTFRPHEACWWLWRPCRTCGGVEVPLRNRTATLDGRPCPACETQRRRLEPPSADPAVWYDTKLEGWVVRLPCGDPPAAALMPIEIRWYDAGWAEVHRAAADLAYGLELD